MFPFRIWYQPCAWRRRFSEDVGTAGAGFRVLMPEH